MPSSRGLAQALLARQILAEEDVNALLVREQAEQQPLAQILLSEGRVSEKQLAEAHAAQLGVPFADLATSGWQPEIAALVPPELVERHRAVPVRATPDGTLVVAFADTPTAGALDAIAQATGRPCMPAVADRRELGSVMEQVLGRAPGGPVPPADSAAGEAAATRTGLRTRPSPAGGSEARAHAAGDPLAAADASFSTASVPAALATLDAQAPRTADSGVIEMPELVESERRDEKEEAPAFDLHVNDLLERVIEDGASDLHLTAGSPPQIRVNGELERLDEFGVMDPPELRRMLYGILTQKQRETLESDWELDLSHPLPGKGRFRVNVFFQRDSIGSVMRAIPNQVVPLEMLGLPRAVRNFADYPRGLVLVTGPTGSGKSTTLASLLDIINTSRPCHMMTVEDPIEFLHVHKRAIVNQREVGEDTHGFANALRHVLRQDPDVILVGEMRDLETIQTALTAAETGHLVFATLHTQDAPQSIDRIIDVFPAHQQDQVRVQLATTLQAIMTQQLIRSADGSCRYVAAEVMVATPAIRNLIREGKIYQIYSAMQSGGQHGMLTMDQSLAELVGSGRIPYEVALERCANQSDLARLCGRM